MWVVLEWPWLLHDALRHLTYRLPQDRQCHGQLEAKLTGGARRWEGAEKHVLSPWIDEQSSSAHARMMLLEKSWPLRGAGNRNSEGFEVHIPEISHFWKIQWCGQHGGSLL